MAQQEERIGQQVPTDAVKICEEILADMKVLSNYEVYINMDETPCYFDLPSKHTGVKTVKMHTTRKEKLKYAAVLTAGVVRNKKGNWEEFQLPPMLIF